MARRTVQGQRGFNLVELMVAMVAMLVIIALVVRTMIRLEQDQAQRRKVAELQTNARQALDLVMFDLRHASLGTSSGVIWTAAGVRRPAIQIVTSVSGGGVLADAKPGTDAVLIVQAAPGSLERSVVAAALSSSFTLVPVTDATSFHVDDFVLIGDYGDAAWGQVSAVTSEGTGQQLTLAAAAVVPGAMSQLGRGAAVRAARVRLYYVTTADELVRLTLAAPRPPADTSEVLDRSVLSAGVENLQVDCQLDDAVGGLVACSDASHPAPVLVGDPILTEAATAFGTFTTNAGPRLSASNIGSLRAVTLHVAVRSTRPVVESRGDDRIPLFGALGTAVTLGPGSATGYGTTDRFPRRAYRLTAAVRNTSLWSF